MIKLDKQNRINVRVRPGSALERYIQRSSLRTATDLLHDLATRLEQIQESR